MTGGFYHRYGKRAIDIVVSVSLLILLLPLFSIIYLLTAAFMGRPVFFIQERPGKDGKLFRMFKFRSMKHAPGATPNSDSQRLTLYGKILRGSSMDELPELWNVLRGQMSLIGPRPLLTQYLPRYSKEQARRHNVLPGMTGWAQVNGRNSIDWETKFKHDVWYVDNLSFALDLKIAFMTIARIVSRSGVSAAGQATMTEFMGNENIASNVPQEGQTSPENYLAPDTNLDKTYTKHENDITLGKAR